VTQVRRPETHRLRGIVAALTLSAVCLATSAGAAEVWVVGDGWADLGGPLADLGLTAEVVGSVARVPAGARTVLVLADGRGAPRALSAAEVTRLERLAQAGARVYVEYPRPEGSTLFGLAVGAEVRRPLYERLVVLAPLGTLEPEDLLEEHDRACVSLGELPPGAQTLLEYDRALGTYSREPWPERGAYTATVDLGAVHDLSDVVGHYGAGQPNYLPESVELWLSEDGTSFRQAGRLAQDVGETVRLAALGRARYVRLVARKFRRSPVTDFLFMGEIETHDARGRNVALNAPYTLTGPGAPAGGGYQDDGRKLTDGVPEGLYTDLRSVGWSTSPPPGTGTFPGLVRVPWGQGEGLVSAAALSDFRRANFRLTERWEELWRQVLLELTPGQERPQVAARYVPLEAHTEPRVWVAPGTPARLVVTAAPGATARAWEGEVELTLTPGEGGHWEAALSPAEGVHPFRVTAETATGHSEREVSLECSARETKYRAALDRNMQWLTRSGVLPEADGSGGVYSQVCLAWLESRPPDYDFLGSPFRVDCNAMTAEALTLYGRLTGDERWRRMGRNVADTVVAHQFRDPAKASLGGFPWLYKDCDVLFFWDDNCRIGTALASMYHWTGDQRYLESAALGGELFRQVARPDACVHNHAISREELDATGREAYRERSQGTDVDFRLMHWWTLAAASGDPIFRQLAETCTDVWGRQAWLQGAPYALRYTGDPALRARIAECIAQYMRNPSVQRWGVPTVAGGGYEAAFEGDCGIATRDGEPLADLIYVLPWDFLWLLRAWKATGDDAARQACETVGDALVRMQFDSPDPRLDGCWMRGFDVERGEVYGAPYDPAYGPYSAYTGWMNAIADQALAWCLLDEDPFIAQASADPGGVVGRARALSPRLPGEGENLALGRAYVLDDPGAGQYADDGRRLTDGIIDGHWSDGRSVGWNIPQQGQTLRRTLTLDLGQTRSVGLVTQQYGAGSGGYNPDDVVVSGSVDGEAWTELGRRTFRERGAALLQLYLAPSVEVRYLRFELTKRRVSAVTDFLFLGETAANE
jgi:hypothetical protein